LNVDYTVHGEAEYFSKLITNLSDYTVS